MITALVQILLALTDIHLFMITLTPLGERSFDNQTYQIFCNLVFLPRFMFVPSRREVYHLQRELLRERTRCKALEEELENPMNIHRWRKLEGSDPSTYEMIQKIQTLQRRLIQKTEEVVEKELLIQVSDSRRVTLPILLLCNNIVFMVPAYYKQFHKIQDQIAPAYGSY